MKNLFFILSFVFTISLIANEPIMRVGLISDTHVTPRKKSVALVREAYKLFKSLKVDIVANMGDIADNYFEAGYKHYREAVREVYPDASVKPLELFVYAAHDVVGRQKENPFEVFKDVKKHLEIVNEPFDIVKFKGYTFLILPQFCKTAEYDKWLAEAVKQTSAGKPLFILDHVPPLNTVHESRVWGTTLSGRRVSKYPFVVHISGHVHGSLVNEKHIWQGSYTAVNPGGLNYWTYPMVGSEPAILRSDMALVMEVYPEKLVFRRFFVRSKKEYKADEPWVVTLPFDPKNAPYDPARRKRESVAPEFSPGSAVTAKMTKNGVAFTFNSAKHKDGVAHYKVLFDKKVDGKWVNFARKDCIGNFAYPEDKRPQKSTHTMSYGYFEKGVDYRISVIPVHIFGKEGKAITGEFNVTEKPELKVIYESKDPMKELSYIEGYGKGRAFKAGTDGFYEVKWARVNTLLVLPQNILTGPKGTRYRITVDIHAKQPMRDVWTMVARSTKPRKNATLRFVTIPGNAGTMRYVMEFKKPNADGSYQLLIREGGVGKIKFDYLKIEKLK